MFSDALSELAPLLRLTVQIDACLKIVGRRYRFRLSKHERFVPSPIGLRRPLSAQSTERYLEGEEFYARYNQRRPASKDFALDIAFM